MSTYRVFELIGSTNSTFTLKSESGRHSVTVDFVHGPEADTILRQLCSDGLRSGSGLSLHFEHLRSDDPLPAIDVYLNLENVNTPDEKNYIGSMGLYGIVESTVDGTGQDRIFDVGAVFIRVCLQSNWSPEKFSLTLIPSRPLAPETELSIGRIALYYYEL